MRKKSRPARRAVARVEAGRQRSRQPNESDLDWRAELPASLSFLSKWSSAHSYALLSAVTILSLIPFSGKAFHLDDSLFLFAAKQIVKHPLDPYGFQIVWNKTLERMSDVTKNPPLTCYYAALVGRVAGWSERAFHLAFLLPALGLVLGTYRLAQRCTRFPLLAALATLFTPGVLVSATSIMCDTMMVALWVWAAILWAEGLEPLKPTYLLASSLLLAASALTKYFGLALIPLLVVYSLVRLRRFGWWAAYLVIPVLSLVGYEIWTAGLYGQGLISDAAEFAGSQREFQQGSTMAHGLVSLSFAGGCALTALTFAPLLWSRKQILAGIFASGFGAAALTFNWVDFGARVGGRVAAQSISDHWLLILFQLTLCITAGVSVLALAIADVWTHKKDAASWLLAMWVAGTWIFAGFVNWTVNARSVLPLIPAAGILIVRHLDRLPSIVASRRSTVATVSGLVVAAVFSFAITASDVAWANSAREAANLIYQKTRAKHGSVYFLGHWGFQYYMDQIGARPLDTHGSRMFPGDWVVVPTNNTNTFSLARNPRFQKDPASFDLDNRSMAATICPQLGAGFYTSIWGPLPFAFGPVPSERYTLLRFNPRH